MNPDRIEEVLMAAIAVLMLTYLLPFSLLRNILVTLFIAIGLIALLVLRSFSWHKDAVTPFDGVLIVGICISVLYLFSFSAFQRSVYSFIALVLFAAFYGLMAFLLYQHRFLFRHAQPVDHAHDPVFKRGIEPIPERAPPHKRTVMSFFKRKPRSFKRGMEPIHEITPAHLHKLGVYDAAPRTKGK